MRSGRRGENHHGRLPVEDLSASLGISLKDRAVSQVRGKKFNMDSWTDVIKRVVSAEMICCCFRKINDVVLKVLWINGRCFFLIESGLSCFK